MGKKTTVKMEYKDTWIDINIPIDATIIQYKAKHFPEIPVHKNPEQAIRKALENPIAMPTIGELVSKDSKVTIAFDDPVKNPQPIKIIIPIVIRSLLKAGVNEKDITLVCANGAHCMWRPYEMKAHLGPELYKRFRPYGWREGRIINHDCSDGTVDFGETELGDEVDYNKVLKESDQLIYIGTVIPLPYGGYMGQGIVIGLASMRTLKSIHSYDVYKSSKVLLGDSDPERNIYRKHKLAIHKQIERSTGKRVFYVDALMGPGAQIMDVFAGHVPELEKVEYPAANKYFSVEVEQADIVVTGLPYTGMYDTSDNPGQASNAISVPLRMWRNKPLLKENGVIISLGQCIGKISERRPGDEKALKLYRQCFGAEDFYDYVDSFCNDEELLYQYRNEYAYSPIHSVFMMANIDTLQKVARHRIIAGNVNPSLIREMGGIPAHNFDEAFSIAKSMVGADPHVLVLPNYNHDPKMVFDVV